METGHSQLVKEAIASSGLKQKKICEVVGISAGTLSRFLNGKGDIGADHFVKILELLGIDVLVLLKYLAFRSRRQAIPQELLQASDLHFMIDQLAPQERKIIESSVKNFVSVR